MHGRIRIDDDQAVEPAEMFRLMRDPARPSTILACLDVVATAGERVERPGIPASLVFHHLRLLRADWRGWQAFHAVQDEPVRSMVSAFGHVAGVNAEVAGRKGGFSGPDLRIPAVGSLVRCGAARLWSGRASGPRHSGTEANHSASRGGHSGRRDRHQAART